MLIKRNRNVASKFNYEYYRPNLVLFSRIFRENIYFVVTNLRGSCKHDKIKSTCIK